MSQKIHTQILVLLFCTTSTVTGRPFLSSTLYERQEFGDGRECAFSSIDCAPEYEQFRLEASKRLPDNIDPIEFTEGRCYQCADPDDPDDGDYEDREDDDGEGQGDEYGAEYGEDDEYDEDGEWRPVENGEGYEEEDKRVDQRGFHPPLNDDQPEPIFLTDE